MRPLDTGEFKTYSVGCRASHATAFVVLVELETEVCLDTACAALNFCNYGNYNSIYNTYLAPNLHYRQTLIWRAFCFCFFVCCILFVCLLLFFCCLLHRPTEAPLKLTHTPKMPIRGM